MQSTLDFIEKKLTSAIEDRNSCLDPHDRAFHAGAVDALFGILRHLDTVKDLVEWPGEVFPVETA